MKKFLGILLLFLSTAAFSKTYKLQLKTFYTSDENLGPGAIPAGIFQKNGYVNSYEGKNFCWIETSVPIKEITAEDGSVYNFILFNPETIICSDIYFLNSDNEWVLTARTGAGLKQKDRTTPFWFNSFDIPQDILKNEKTGSVKLRIRIFSTKSSCVQLKLVSSAYMTRYNITMMIFYGFLAGAAVFTIIYIFYSSYVFLNNEIIYISIICIILFIKVIFGTGIINSLQFTQSHQFYKLIYLLLTTEVFLNIKALKAYNKPFRNNFPEYFFRIENSSTIIMLATTTAGILYIVLPLNSSTEKAVLLSSLIILNAFFTLKCFYSFKYNPSIRKSFYLSLICANYLLFFEQLFLSIRFFPNSTVLCRVFDNNMEIPTVISMFMISTAALRKLHFNIRTNLASMQIDSQTVQNQIQEENRKKYVFSKMTKMASNPLQIISAEIEKNKHNIPHPLLTKIRHELTQFSCYMETLTILSEYKEKDTCSQAEPVILKELIEESIAPEIANLRLRNCYVDIKYDFNPETKILSDRNLLSMMFKFILQAAVNNTRPETTINLSFFYKNLTLKYKVHFHSKPVSSKDADKIISLDINSTNQTEEETEHIEKLLKEWGIQLHIAKRILDLNHGIITFTPDTDGNTIYAKIAAEQAASTSFLYTEDSAQTAPVMQDNNEVPPSCQAENQELIYIMEEDAEVREELKQLLLPYFRIVCLSNGSDFDSRIHTEQPDLILCSDSLPGKSAFELLESNNNNFNAAFLVLSRTITKQAMNNLFMLGAFDIIQKPFNEKLLVSKIKSIITTRRKQTEQIISKIENTLRNSVFSNTPITSWTTEGTAEQKEPKTEPQTENNRKKTPNAENGLRNSSFLALCVCANLTKKETAVAILIAQGFSDKEIAEKENISPKTVAVHNKKIFKKLNIHSRTELTEIAGDI